MEAVAGKGKRRSVGQRRELLAPQRQSGLSVAAFCRERSLSSESFYRWRREAECQGPALLSTPGATVIVHFRSRWARVQG